MKRTNRILALILALVMALALAACGNGAGTGNTPSTTAPETSAPETAAPETTAPSTGDKDYGDYSAENPLELKLSHFAGNDTNQLAQLAIAFERIVEEKTGGAVDVVIYGGGVLGNDRESFESVIAGTLDMAVNNTPIISNYDEIFQVLDLPYLFQDYDHINAFLASDICQQLLDSLTSTGARMLCMQAVGFRNMDMCTGPVKTPADIAGTKIRVTDSPIYRAQYEAWGANPQIIAGPEVLTALQQGTIDGCDNVHNVQYADRYYEFAKYISITEHAVHFNGLTINNALFEGLSADLQADILAAAQEAAAERTEALRVENDELLATMESEGAVVTKDVDKQSFIDAVQPLYEDFTANHSAGSYVEQIQARRLRRACPNFLGSAEDPCRAGRSGACLSQRSRKERVHGFHAAKGQ